MEREKKMISTLTTNDQTKTDTYQPGRLFDQLIERLKLKNDAALARYLEVDQPVISKIRHRKMKISAALLLRMHDFSGIAVNELRDLMSAPRVEAPAAKQSRIVRPEFPGNPFSAELVG